MGFSGEKSEYFWLGLGSRNCERKGVLFCSSFPFVLFSANGVSQIKIEKSKRDFSLNSLQCLTAAGTEKVGSEH